ncbi:MAG: hypothetical protein WD181_04745 [Solirubrobacterales bacterium]
MSESTAPNKVKATTWATWVAFAAIIMMLSGVFSVIAGLAAALDDDYFATGTANGNIFLLSTTALGIFWIVLGVIKAWAGFALIQGREWARVVTIIICAFHATTNLLTLTAQPFLSLLFIAFNLIVLYAVTVRWEEAKIGMGD